LKTNTGRIRAMNDSDYINRREKEDGMREFVEEKMGTEPDYPIPLWSWPNVAGGKRCPAELV
jgi:hypothetical protein